MQCVIVKNQNLFKEPEASGLLSSLGLKTPLNKDKFMPEMHLRQPGFTYSACGPFTKNKERIQKFKETRHS